MRFTFHWRNPHDGEPFLWVHQIARLVLKYYWLKLWGKLPPDFEEKQRRSSEYQ